MTKITNMIISDTCIALAKVKDRLDRYIMIQADRLGKEDDALKHYIEYVQVQRDIISHLEDKIKRMKRAKLNGEIALIFSDLE